MFSARVRALGGALTGTDYYRLGYFFFAHAYKSRVCRPGATALT